MSWCDWLLVYGAVVVAVLSVLALLAARNDRKSLTQK